MVLCRTIILSQLFRGCNTKKHLLAAATQYFWLAESNIGLLPLSNAFCLIFYIAIKPNKKEQTMEIENNVSYESYCALTIFEKMRCRSVSLRHLILEQGTGVDLHFRRWRKLRWPPVFALASATIHRIVAFVMGSTPSCNSPKEKTALWAAFSFGAGYGNRTRLHGLGSRCITDIRTLQVVGVL